MLGKKTLFTFDFVVLGHDAWSVLTVVITSFSLVLITSCLYFGCTSWVAEMMLLMVVRVIHMEQFAW